MTETNAEKKDYRMCCGGLFKSYYDGVLKTVEILGFNFCPYCGSPIQKLIKGICGEKITTASNPWYELQLEIRTCNVLMNNNINTIGQLISMSKPDVLSLRGVGKGIFEELSNELSKYGFTIPDTHSRTCNW